MKDELSEKVEQVLECDFYYFIECPHCETVFFIEESIDKGHHYDARTQG